MSAVVSVGRQDSAARARRQAWVERLRLALRTPSLIVGAAVILF